MSAAHPFFSTEVQGIKFLQPVFRYLIEAHFYRKKVVGIASQLFYHRRITTLATQIAGGRKKAANMPDAAQKRRPEQENFVIKFSEHVVIKT